MANICDTTYKITGSHDVVNGLFKVLQQLDKQKRSNIRLCELAAIYGIDYENESISVRGEIYHFDMDENNDVLTIDVESAWTGCHVLFRSIKTKLSDELSISYREIECGCGIYCVHDEYDFFPARCLVSANGEPFEDCMEDPYDTVSDAIDYWCESMDIARNGRSDEEMMAIINDYEYEDEDTYFYINEFEFE